MGDAQEVPKKVPRRPPKRPPKTFQEHPKRLQETKRGPKRATLYSGRSREPKEVPREPSLL